MQALLEKTSYNPENDHLVFTGDLINKGPISGSLSVLQFARSAGASCVRGNHDHKILTRYSDLSSQSPMNPESELAASLPSDSVSYLQSCPLMLTVPQMPGLGDTVIVHAGVVPGIPLRKQEPGALMNVRTLGRGGRWTREKGGTHWAVPWNKVMGRRGNPVTVVYGHYAGRGLDIRRFTKGLDSGCVRGGRLTAMVIERDTEVPEVVQVECEEYAEGR